MTGRTSESQDRNLERIDEALKALGRDGELDAPEHAVQDTLKASF